MPGAQPFCAQCRTVRQVASAAPSTVKIITQGRHVEVTPALKSYVEEKLGKVVVKYEAAIKEVDVRLSATGGDASKGAKKQKTEITIYTLRNGIVRAEDVEESMYAAIDLVSDKVARKLRKMKEKAIARGKWAGPGGPRGGETIGQSLPSEAEDLVDKLPTDQEAAAFPEVVRTKTFVLEPMSLEDALEQVEQVGHPFFVFRDKSSKQVRVLYKRKTRGYGVIVPQED
ncbi:g3433 [Coccomyxa elongata]